MSIGFRHLEVTTTLRGTVSVKQQSGGVEGWGDVWQQMAVSYERISVRTVRAYLKNKNTTTKTLAKKTRGKYHSERKLKVKGLFGQG